MTSNKFSSVKYNFKIRHCLNSVLISWIEYPLAIICEVHSLLNSVGRLSQTLDYGKHERHRNNNNNIRSRRYFMCMSPSYMMMVSWKCEVVSTEIIATVLSWNGLIQGHYQHKCRKWNCLIGKARIVGRFLEPSTYRERGLSQFETQSLFLDPCGGRDWSDP